MGPSPALLLPPLPLSRPAEVRVLLVDVVGEMYYKGCMGARLDETEETVTVSFRMPADLRDKAKRLARDFADGDLSAWLRGEIRRAWARSPLSGTRSKKHA